MDKRHEKVYKQLCKSCEDLKIKYQKTPNNKDGSENSFSFIYDKNDICSFLVKNFEIDNPNFNELFNQACSGSGQEKKKISILRSSSLCALLFFNNIENVNIILNIEDKQIIFDKAFFEIKNNVISNPSNIDVVLISSKQKKILYLESKYSEYYLSCGCKNISKSYLSNEIAKKVYNQQILNSINFESTFDIFMNSNGEEVFKVDSNKSKRTGTKSYVEGIKQMVSHYIGVDNIFKTDIYEKDERNKILFDLIQNEAYEVYLGEILFDFEDEEIHQYLVDYEEKYSHLREILSPINTKIHMLKNPLYYSELKEYVNPKIKYFYFGEK